MDLGIKSFAEVIFFFLFVDGLGETSLNFDGMAGFKFTTIVHDAHYNNINWQYRYHSFDHQRPAMSEVEESQFAFDQYKEENIFDQNKFNPAFNLRDFDLRRRGNRGRGKRRGRGRGRQFNAFTDQNNLEVKIQKTQADSKHEVKYEYPYRPAKLQEQQPKPYKVKIVEIFKARPKGLQFLNKGINIHLQEYKIRNSALKEEYRQQTSSDESEVKFDEEMSLLPNRVATKQRILREKGFIDPNYEPNIKLNVPLLEIPPEDVKFRPPQKYQFIDPHKKRIIKPTPVRYFKYSGFDSFLERRKNLTENGQKDLGVLNLDQVLEECQKKKILSMTIVQDFLNQNGYLHLKIFFTNYATNTLHNCDYKRSRFTILDHRRLCELLIYFHPSEYTMGPLECLHLDVKEFLKRIYSLSAVEYAKAYKIIDQITGDSWWKEIKSRYQENQQHRRYFQFKEQDAVIPEYVELQEWSIHLRNIIGDLKLQNSEYELQKILAMKNAKNKPHLNDAYSISDKTSISRREFDRQDFEGQQYIESKDPQNDFSSRNNDLSSHFFEYDNQNTESKGGNWDRLFQPEQQPEIFYDENDEQTSQSDLPKKKGKSKGKKKKKKKVQPVEDEESSEAPEKRPAGGGTKRPRVKNATLSDYLDF